MSPQNSSPFVAVVLGKDWVEGWLVESEKYVKIDVGGPDRSAVQIDRAAWDSLKREGKVSLSQRTPSCRTWPVQT